MQVKELEVSRRPSYDDTHPNQLVGTVTLTGALGEQKIKLSNGALSRIFGVIAQEVQDTARSNAEQVKRGMADATDEPLMLEASNVGKVEVLR